MSTPRIFLPLLLVLLGTAGLRAQDNSIEGPLPPPHPTGPQVAGPATPGDPNAPAPAGPKALTNDAVVRLTQAGLGEYLIVQTIDTQPGTYKTDPDALIALKQAGVTERVIAAMMRKPAARRQITPARETPLELSDVNETGVYYKDRDGRWTLMETEVVHIKSGGFIKSTVTYGVIKQDRNGHINGRESKLLLPRPIEFLISTADGVTPGEYDLLRFRVNKDNREFRSFTGGIIHSSSGADRDEVEFKPVRTAPHTYQFTLDNKFPGGEYGILPPGTGNITNGGKIYTFAISE